MLKELSLAHVGPAQEMVFSPRSRLNVITGDNGLGKSFLLELAWWAITRTWAGTPIRPPLDPNSTATVNVSFAAQTKTANLKMTYDRADQSWRFPKGKPGQPGLVIYARVDGDFAVWDSNRRFGDPGEADTGVPKGLVFSKDAVWDGLLLNGKPICNGLLADWTSWQQRQTWEAAALARSLEKLSPSPDQIICPGEPSRVDLLDSRLIPTLQMPYDEQLPVTLASAGMKRILALAYLLVWAWREHIEVSRIAGRPPAERMLLIIDEIEAHLHPRWQRIILSSLVETLAELTSEPAPGLAPHRAPEIQFIVATHSPLVLASLEPLFDQDTDALFELHLEETESGRRVMLRDGEFRRRGGAEDWLISDAFGLRTSRSLPAEHAVEEASLLLQREDPASPTELASMAERLTGVLPDIDPFWTRWRAMTSRESLASAGRSPQ